jgi:hypothetical protein
MVKLFEYKHFEIISHYCYHINYSFALSVYECITHMFFINIILEPMSDNVINVVALPHYNTRRPWYVGSKSDLGPTWGFCIVCEGYISKSSPAKNIGIYQVVSEILQNQILMVLRILEKNPQQIVILFLHNTACISFSQGEHTDSLKQLMWTLYSNDDMLAI